MGKKKFLDKKKSAVFTLVYRDTENQDEDTENPLRQFVRVDRGAHHVPGFSEDDPRSLSEDEGLAQEVDDDDDDSRFADADEGEDDEEDYKEEDEVGSVFHASQSSKTITRKTVFGSRRLPENARLELIELGFPDDGYDYRKHMRNISSASAFVPSTSTPEPLQADVRAYDASDVGVQSAPVTRKDAEETFIGSISSASRPITKSLSRSGLLDAEIVAALESSDGSQFDSADELEDQFVVLANEGLAPGDASPDRNRATTRESPKTDPFRRLQRLDDDEDDDDLSDMPLGESRERPSRLLDEQFEALALNEYDESDFEEMDEDDPSAKGHADISQFDSVLSEFLIDSDLHSERYKSISESRYSSSQTTGFQSNHGDTNGGKAGLSNMVVNKDVGAIVAQKTKELVRNDDNDGQVVELDESEDDSDGWDCESVISTFSNLDNHPAKIGAPGKPKGISKILTGEEPKLIRLGGKQHLPLDYLPGKQEGSQKGRKGATEAAKTASKGGRSRAGETPEEKKERKAAVKAGRKEARQTKKDVKLRYRDEASQAQHGAASMGPSAIHLS